MCMLWNADAQKVGELVTVAIASKAIDGKLESRDPKSLWRCISSLKTPPARRQDGRNKEQFECQRNSSWCFPFSLLLSLLCYSRLGREQIEIHQTHTQPLENQTNLFFVVYIAAYLKIHFTLADRICSRPCPILSTNSTLRPFQLVACEKESLHSFISLTRYSFYHDRTNSGLRRQTSMIAQSFDHLLAALGIHSE